MRDFREASSHSFATRTDVTEEPELLAGLDWLDTTLSWINRQQAMRSLALAQAHRHSASAGQSEQTGEAAIDQMRDIEAIAGLVSDLTRDMNNRLASIMVGLDLLHRNLAATIDDQDDHTTTASSPPRPRRGH